MKTNSRALIILLFCFVCITGCKKKDALLQNAGGNTPTDTTHTGSNTQPPGGGSQTGGVTQIAPGTIFISGYEGGQYTGNDVAEYWRDGIVKQLTDGKNIAQATGIAVSGNDVYVSGYEMKNNISVAKYWKNDVAVTLSDGTLETQATGITVVGNDIYVCGYEINAAKYTIAKYWKNGVVVTIPYEGLSSGSIPYAIAVSGSDVYLAGLVFNNITNFSTAKYWKNTNVDVNLTGYLKNPSAIARTLYIDGSDIYVAGDEQTADHTSVSIAEYWKNSVWHQLSDNVTTASANAIVVKGIDVYVAGWHQIFNSKIYAIYWKNGAVINFSDGTNVAIATGIALSGNDVYGVGYEVTDASRYYSVPRCWKNNTIVPLASATGGSSGRATGIAIAK